jgi:hypothetical protein
MPSAILILIFYVGSVARDVLFEGDSFGGGQGCGLAGKWFRERPIERIGPTAVVSDYSVMNFGHDVCLAGCLEHCKCCHSNEHFVNMLRMPPVGCKTAISIERHTATTEMAEGSPITQDDLRDRAMMVCNGRGGSGCPWRSFVSSAWLTSIVFYAVNGLRPGIRM